MYTRSQYIFRGKTIHTKEWVYGSLIGNNVIAPRGQTYYLDEGYCDGMKGYMVDPESVGQYIPILNAYVGDILYGYEKDEYGTTVSTWMGVIEYNNEYGRYMVQDDVENWYEVDNFLFDEVIGSIYDTSKEAHL